MPRRLEAMQARDEPAHREGAETRYVQRPVRILPQPAHARLDPVEAGREVAQKGRAGRRESKAVLRPFEQKHPENRFEMSHLPADGAMRHAQFAARPRHASKPARRFEG